MRIHRHLPAQINGLTRTLHVYVGHALMFHVLLSTYPIHEAVVQHIGGAHGRCIQHFALFPLAGGIPQYDGILRGSQGKGASLLATTAAANVTTAPLAVTARR